MRGVGSAACGRYALYSSADDLVALFRIVGSLELVPRFNVAPTQLLPVLLHDHTVATMKWGLVPTWSTTGKGVINARAEGLFDKPMFRTAARKRRCLVPADGFYEWRKSPSGKQPLLIRRPDRKPFLMAGVWEPGEPPTFAIVTTAANAVVAPVHDRMPVILDAAQVEPWLAEGTLPPPEDIAPVDLTPVSDRVNNVRNDDPACLEGPMPSLFPGTG